MNDEQIKIIEKVFKTYYKVIQCNEFTCPCCEYGDGYNCKLVEIENLILKENKK